MWLSKGPLLRPAVLLMGAGQLEGRAGGAGGIEKLGKGGMMGKKG